MKELFHLMNSAGNNYKIAIHNHGLDKYRHENIYNNSYLKACSESLPISEKTCVLFKKYKYLKSDLYAQTLLRIHQF